MSVRPLNQPLPPYRAPEPGGGQALLGAFASTLSLLHGLLVLLLLIYLGSGITFVSASEDAVVYRLGRLQPRIHPPGLLLALPRPFDRVRKISTRTQHEVALVGWSPDDDNAALHHHQLAGRADATTPVGLHPVFEGYTLTADRNIVQARFGVRYRIVDPLAYVAAAPERTIDHLLEAAVFATATHTLATMRVDEVLGGRLEAFRQAVRVGAQQRADALKLGVEIVAFEVAALTPPAATVDAFAGVTSAQVEARTQVDDARTYRAQVIPAAHAEANRLRQDAEAQRHERVARATAEAQSFTALAAQQAAQPGLVASRLRSETLDTVFAQVRTRTVLPADSGAAHLVLPVAP